MSAAERTSSTVPLDWSEVYYTNCPLVSASNVDQELGWTKEEYKKIGVSYAYFRSRRENNWYPHYTHNLPVGDTSEEGARCPRERSM